MQWWGISLEDFGELTGETQDWMLEVYRAHNQIEAILADERNREIEKANRSRKK
jgi:hypothetical protein